MATAQPLKGSCLCGACTFTAAPVGETANVCHCEMCRRWTGGMYMAVDCGDSVVFEPSDSLATYRGSDWGERVFCKTCGTSLVWRTQDRKSQGVSMQAFEDPSQFELTNQWFIDRKPANYALVNKTREFTEAETIALFTAEGGN